MIGAWEIFLDMNFLFRCNWTRRSLCLDKEHLMENVAVVEKSSRTGNMKSESVFQSLSLGWSL